MDTCVPLENAYLRFNGYASTSEYPVLVGEGRPYRYHTATDIDILAVRFPNSAVVARFSIANPRVQQAAENNEPVMDAGLEERDPKVTQPVAPRETQRPRKRKAPPVPRRPAFDRPAEVEPDAPARSKPKGVWGAGDEAAKRAPRKPSVTLNLRTHRGGKHGLRT